MKVILSGSIKTHCWTVGSSFGKQVLLTLDVVVLLFFLRFRLQYEIPWKPPSCVQESGLSWLHVTKTDALLSEAMAFTLKILGSVSPHEKASVKYCCVRCRYLYQR